MTFVLLAVHFELGDTAYRYFNETFSHQVKLLILIQVKTRLKKKTNFRTQCLKFIEPGVFTFMSYKIT